MSQMKGKESADKKSTSNKVDLNSRKPVEGSC